MKQQILLFFLLLLATGISAAPVDQEAAKQSAKTFMAQRGKKKVDRMSLAYKGTSTRAHRMPGTTPHHPAYYVFNNKEEGGFVIVSGDSRTATILGYSDEGSFDPANIPENMAEWLKGYADQIAYLDEADIQTSQTGRMKSPTMRAINPLLKSRWTQDTPFSNLLPVISGSHLPVGCGATAMAQVMYYHQWPQATIADIPGYKNTVQYSNYDEISFDTIPAGQTFDWANMKDVYGGRETDAQNNAVAVLSRCCGVALKMRYAVGGSSSSLSDYPHALTTYFGYDSKVEHKKRENYGYDAWMQMLYKELSEGRPVAYGGQSGGGGHAFVIDGYDGEELFHVNWGWNNGTDGYFLLSVLNPNDNSGTGASSTGSGYNLDQEAVIGIQPSTGGQSTTPDDETPLQLTFDIDKIVGDTISGRYHNYTGEQKTFLYTLGYYDEAGELQTCSGLYGNNLPSGYYWYFDLDVRITQPGRYIVFPMSKVYGTEEWVPMPHNVNYIEVIVDEDGTRTLIWHPIKALEATFAYSEPKFVGVPQKVDIAIKNIGEEYTGNLYFFATNSEADFSSKSSFNIQLIPGKSTTARVGFTPSAVGNYDIALATDADGNDIIATSSVYITEGSYTTDEILTTKVTLENTTGRKIYGNKIKGVYTITNPTETTWSGRLRFFIYHNDNGGSGTYYSVQYIDYSEVLQPGESVGLPFEYTGIYGDYYIIGMKYMRTYHEVGTSGTYQLLRGYVTYKADGTVNGAPATGAITIGDDVVAVDFNGITEDAITSITPNGNPNTLYYLSEGSTLAGKFTANVNNIVYGTASTSITLVDNHDFYIPITFTADHVTYSRRPALVSDGDKWETIALPFEVGRVTVSGREIDYHHSLSDQGKEFWVKEFNEYEGKDIYFGIPEKMEAYVPYLIGFSSTLAGKDVVFEGTDATLISDSKLVSGSQYYNLIGTMVSLAKRNVYMVSADGTKFTLKSQATVPPFRAYMNAKYEEGRPANIPIQAKPLLGDVNGDGTVTISDITLMVNYVLQKTNNIVFQNADVNKDEKYNISDVTMIVNIILSKQ